MPYFESFYTRISLNPEWLAIKLLNESGERWWDYNAALRGFQLFVVIRYGTVAEII
jgi:hypothetical protein